MYSSWCPALAPSEVGDHQLWGLQPSSGGGALLCWTKAGLFHSGPWPPGRWGDVSAEVTEGERGVRVSPQDQRGGVKDLTIMMTTLEHPC